MSKRALEGEDGSSPKKKRAVKETKPLDPKKFGGKTEEEVCQMLLPDHLALNLDIIFMGINPGLYSAYLGHHYCNANNHFWPCLYESGLIPKKLSFMEDAEVLNYGIGMSNIVPRTTRSAIELSRKEIKEWSKVMIERMQELKPLIICFNGKGIYEIYTGGKCTVGVQEEPLPGTDIVVYVMPSTSGRAATYPKRSDKLKFFTELKDLRDRLRSEREEREKGELTKHTPVGSSDRQVQDEGKHENSVASGETVNMTDESVCSTGPAGGGSTSYCEDPSTTLSGGDQVLQRVPVIVNRGRNSIPASSCGWLQKAEDAHQVPTTSGASEGAQKLANVHQKGISTDRGTDEGANVVIGSPYFHQQN